MGERTPEEIAKVLTKAQRAWLVKCANDFAPTSIETYPPSLALERHGLATLDPYGFGSVYIRVTRLGRAVAMMIAAEPPK